MAMASSSHQVMLQAGVATTKLALLSSSFHSTSSSSSSSSYSSASYLGSKLCCNKASSSLLLRNCNSRMVRRDGDDGVLELRCQATPTPPPTTLPHLNVNITGTTWSLFASHLSLFFFFFSLSLSLSRLTKAFSCITEDGKMYVWSLCSMLWGQQETLESTHNRQSCPQSQ